MNTSVEARGAASFAPDFADGAVQPGSPLLLSLFDAIAEGASERDRTRAHPHEALQWLRRARFGAYRLPVAVGGGGASLRELLQAVLALGAADSNVAHVLRNHFTFVERFVQAAAQRDPAHPWVRAVAAGQIFGLASGELGSAAVGASELQTTLVSDDQGGYRLQGVKYYSTGSLYADFVLVRARTPDGRNASAVVPVDREGLRLDDDWDGVGQRLTGTGTTWLEQVAVAADEVVFDSDGADYRLAYSSTLPQLFLTTVLAGIARAIERDALALVRRRAGRNFGHSAAARPIDDPVIQQTVGEIGATAFAAEAIVLAAADALDRVNQARATEGGEQHALAHAAAVAAAQAKVVVDELVVRVAGQLFDVGGASAATQRYNLDRHWRNARTLASHNPATLKARNLGEHALLGTVLPSGFF